MTRLNYGTGVYRGLLLVIMWFCSARFPLPLGAWDRLHYFIVALPGPSIQLFSIIMAFSKLKGLRKLIDA